MATGQLANDEYLALAGTTGLFTDHELNLVANWLDIELERTAIAPELHRALTQRVNTYRQDNAGRAK